MKIIILLFLFILIPVLIAWILRLYLIDNCPPGKYISYYQYKECEEDYYCPGDGNKYICSDYAFVSEKKDKCISFKEDNDFFQEDEPENEYWRMKDNQLNDEYHTKEINDDENNDPEDLH